MIISVVETTERGHTCMCVQCWYVWTMEMILSTTIECPECSTELVLYQGNLWRKTDYDKEQAYMAPTKGEES